MNTMLHKNKLFTILFFSVQLLTCFAQQLYDRKQPEEKVLLITDRTLYFTKEQIWLKVISLLDQNTDSLSKVMYVELLDRKSKPILQKKLQIIHGLSLGMIEIPDDMVTGNYYLRAYTMYMRNFEKKFFYTTELTIINPSSANKEMLQSAIKDTIAPWSNETSSVEIITKGDPFPPHSLITCHVKGEKNKVVSVSVVKKGSYKQPACGINRDFATAIKKESLVNLEWYPEIRAVSISGKIIDAQNGQAVKGTRVTASVLDGSNQFYISRCNENGEFVFALHNLQGNHQVCISAHSAQRELSILINPDFAQGLPSMTFHAEKMDSAKQVLINEMYRNAQVTAAYKSNHLIPVKSIFDTLPDPFKTSVQTIFLKDYIALPTMTESLNELVPYVKARNKKNEMTIEVVDKYTQYMLEKSLVLFDNIPFYDHSEILGVPPSKINSIAVLPEAFVCGNEIINGLVNIKSNDGNMGGLTLPKNAVIVDYLTYDPEVTATHDWKTDVSATKPGFLNTLYWNPVFNLKDGEQKLEFYSGDEFSEYDIVINGTDEKGEGFTKIKTITVAGKFQNE